MRATAEISPGISTGVPPWINRLFTGLLIYVLVCGAWMLTGLGGERVRYYVGLLGDSPACLAALIVTIAATRRMEHGTTRTAWRCLSIALGIYFVGTSIGVNSWLHGQDPFPGPADFCYLAFYPFFLAAVSLMIRAAAVKVRWAQFLLDALIIVVGFGAFFWFLIIRPSASSARIDELKFVLSQVYIALNCILVLSLGVLLVAGGNDTHNRTVPLLLSVGFTTMLLGDIIWSVAKISGHYLAGDLQDVMYVACYVPLAAAGREQMRLNAGAGAGSAGSGPVVTKSLAQSLPFAAMLAALLVLVSFSSGGIGNPATVMTIIVFGLALLVMVRQALVMREDARRMTR